MLQPLIARFFGIASGKRVLLRVFADFGIAHLSLITAAILRMALNDQLQASNPVGQIAGKVNSLYLLHAGWFSVSAVALFAWAQLYRPLPNSRKKQRLKHVAKACLAGFLAHLAVGTLLQGRMDATLEIAAPAWAILGAMAFGIRYSWMTLGQHYKVVPRHDAIGKDKVDQVLVVGGAGYIGSVLTEQLLKAGYQVRILDLELFGRDSLDTMASHPRLEFQHGDFRNVEDAARALRGVDAVIHLAAIVGDPACALDGDTTIAVNYAAAKMMAQLARANGISRFVFASTCSVYGESEDIRTEESDLNPISLYATTKIDAERALLEGADEVFQPTILRFATAYGWSHRPRFDLVANLFSAQAVTDKKIRIVNGESWRPFVHTRDIARACVIAMEAPLSKVGCEIFNVGDHSQNFTLKQLGDIVAAAEPGLNIEEVSAREDMRNYRVDFTKIQRVLGFRCHTPLTEGIREMVEAVRAGLVTDWKDPIYSNVKTLQKEGLGILKFEMPSEEKDELATTHKFLQARRAA